MMIQLTLLYRAKGARRIKVEHNRRETGQRKPTEASQWTPSATRSTGPQTS
jgi:hypothetical protein